MSGLWRSKFVQWWLPIASAVVLGGTIVVFGAKDLVVWYYQQTGMATLGRSVILVEVMQWIVSLIMVMALVGCVSDDSNMEDRESAVACFYVGAFLCWWPVISCWVATLTMPYNQALAANLLEARFWVVVCGFTAWMAWEIFLIRRHQTKNGKQSLA